MDREHWLVHEQVNAGGEHRRLFDQINGRCDRLRPGPRREVSRRLRRGVDAGRRHHGDGRVARGQCLGGGGVASSATMTGCSGASPVAVEAKDGAAPGRIPIPPTSTAALGLSASATDADTAGGGEGIRPEAEEVVS